MKRTASQATITIAQPAAKRKKSRKKSFASIPRNGVSSTARVKLAYAAEISAVTTGPASIRHNFAVNGLYDPDLTGAGLQPQGFDEWMNLYEDYCVVGGKISVRPLYTGTTSLAPNLYMLSVSDGQVLPGGTGFQDFITAAGDNNPARPTSDWGLSGVISTVNDPYVRKSIKWTAGKIMGLKQSDVHDRTTLMGTSSANPSDLIYGSVHVCPPTAGVGATQYFVVQIEFDVIFSHPKQFTMS